MKLFEGCQKPRNYSLMRFAALSQRESEVVSLLVAGASNREIAARLNVSVNRVKSHVNSIFNKIGVENRTQAAVKAVLLDRG